MNDNKKSLIAACCIFVALTASGVLAAPGLSPSFSYQGRFLNEAGTAPLSGTVDLKLGIYDPSGECLLYEESQTGIDLGASDGLFSVAVGSGLAPSSDATKRTLNDPGKAMAEVFSNASELRAPGLDDCDDGYTPQAGHGRKLRVTITPQGGGPSTTLSPDLEINSVPQAQVADTLQGLDASRFVQITGNASSYVVSNSALNTLLGVGGVQDASSLHHHDSLYAKLSGSSSLALSSGSYLGLGVHAGNPDTTGWAADVTKTGRTWFDSGTNEIKYWDGTAVKSLGTSGAGVTSFNTRSGAVTLSSSDVTTALGFTPEAALTNPNDTTKYYRADKSWQTLNTTAVAEGTNLYFTEARVKGALSGGTGISYSPIDGSISVDAGTAANKIVQLDANAKLPAVDGSALTALNASNIASGTLSVDRIADGSIPATKLDSSVGSWSVDGSGNAYRASGNVGIGTTSPQHLLHVNGGSSGILVTGYAADGPDANVSTLNGQVTFGSNSSYQGRISYNGQTTGQEHMYFVNTYNAAHAGFRFLSPASANPIMALNGSGNVGIGTITPATKLDVSGDVKIGNSLATCSSTTAGSQRYNSSSSAMEVCNGSAWRTLATESESPSSPSSFDDEFGGSLLDAKWAWINQGTATAPVSNGFVGMYDATAGGVDQLRVIKQAVSGTWTITAKMSSFSDLVTCQHGGIAVRESGTGKLIVFGFVSGGCSVGAGLVIYRFSSPTAYTSTSFSTRWYQYSGLLRVQDNGTNLVFSFSPDGVNFIQLFSESRTAYQAGGPDEAGLYIDPKSGANRMFVDWVRKE